MVGAGAELKLWFSPSQDSNTTTRIARLLKSRQDPENTTKPQNMPENQVSVITPI